MKTGIELIAQERREQIVKHCRSVDEDKVFNAEFQLLSAAKQLLFIVDRDDRYFPPSGWSPDVFLKMVRKDYRARLIIAGALIAAELDRTEVPENGQLSLFK